MKFDWTITFGSALTLLLLVISMIRLNWFLGGFMRILKDFPPHRHINDKILYPQGMAPKEPETKDAGIA